MDSYVSGRRPTVEQWIDYNQPVFRWYKGETNTPPKQGFAPFVDVDLHAQAAEMSVEDYFDMLQQRVGSLGGKATLALVHSGMDDAYHVVLVPA